MAIEAGDFKTGLTVMVDGDPWQVIDFMHVKPGKGAAILKTKMKNLKTGSTQGAPSSQTKDAVTDTGLSIRVPQFIEEGEKILVSTSDGKYSSRA